MIKFAKLPVIFFAMMIIIVLGGEKTMAQQTNSAEIRFVWNGTFLTQEIRSTGFISPFLVDGAPANLELEDCDVGGNTMYLGGAPYRVDESYLLCHCDDQWPMTLLGVSDGREGDGRSGEKVFFPINANLSARINSFVWVNGIKYYFNTAKTKFFLNGVALSGPGEDGNYALNLSGAPVMAQVHYWWDGSRLQISTDHKGLDPAYIGVGLPANAPNNLVQAMGSFIWLNFAPWRGHFSDVATIPANGESSRITFTGTWVNMDDWCTTFTFPVTPELQLRINPTFAWQWYTYSYNLNTAVGFLNGMPLGKIRNTDGKESFLLNLPGSIGATANFTLNSVVIDRGNQKLEHLFFNLPAGINLARIGVIHFHETGNPPFTEVELVSWNGQSATINLNKFRSDRHRVNLVGYDQDGNAFYGNILAWDASLRDNQGEISLNASNDGVWLVSRAATASKAWDLYQ